MPLGVWVVGHLDGFSEKGWTGLLGTSIGATRTPHSKAALRKDEKGLSCRLGWGLRHGGELT